MFPTFARLAGGARAFGGALLSLAGGPVGLATAAFTALAGWAHSLRQRLDDLAARNRDLAVSNADLADQIDRSARPFEGLETAISATTAAAAAAVAVNDGYLRGIDARKDALLANIQAEKDLKSAIIDRQVAEGAKAPKEAAKELGDLAKAAAVAAADAEVEAAARKVAASNSAIAKAQQAQAEQRTRAEAEIRAARKRVDELAAQAAALKSEAEKARMASDRTATGATTFGDVAMAAPLGLAAAGAVLAKKDLSEDDIREAQDEADRRAADAAKMAAMLEAERKAGEKLIDAKKAQAAEIAAEVERAKAARDAAAREATRAREDRDRVATFTLPAIDARTAASVADAERQEREAAARAAKDEEKRLREEAKRLRDEQMAAMQTEIQEDSHGLARKADIIDQRGYDDAAKLVDNIATGLAAGASKAELATALHRLGEEAEGAGSSLASMLGSVEASLTDFYRRINRIEGEYAARIARLESQTRANR